MPAPSERSAARRLLLWFAVVTLLPTLALVWVGWAVVVQGHTEQRETTADRAAALLRGILADLGDDLTRAAASPEAAVNNTGPDAAGIAFADTSVRARFGLGLPYYPAPLSTDARPAGVFGRADQLEHRDGDLPGALRELTDLSSSNSVGVRAEALLRLARVHSKSGQNPVALETLDTLQQLDETPAGGLPAGLAARQRRLAIFTETGQTEDAAREASGLAQDLAAGRWVVTLPQYEVARQQVAAVPTNAGPAVADAEATALADATDELWHAWQNSNLAEATGRSTETVGIGDHSVLAVTLREPGQLTLMLVGPESLEKAWREARERAGIERFDFALTDRSGQPVLGHPGDDPDRHTVLPPSATTLPWTVHVVSGDMDLGTASLSGRSRLMLLGIGIMALVVVTTGYVLNRAISREVEVARLKSDFVAAVSHELRTPLTTIRQLSEMLARSRVSSDARRQQFYDTLLAESERLRRMVEGLLDFGRMESGRLEYEFAPVDVSALVKEVAADIERDAGDRGCRVDVSVADDLPPVRGNRESLSRVFGNLLDNAVKYSPEGRTVQVTVSNGDGRVRVDVRDRGLGIPAEEQRRIFDRFVRGAAASTAGIKGTGIGLALARQIVTAHGGEIAVESEPGHGSVFRVTIPAMGETD